MVRDTVVSKSLGTMVSASTNTNTRAVARAAPAFRAFPMPRSSSRTTVAPRSRAMAGVRSVLPLSTTMISAV
jgi:hypothetical protein